MTFIRPIVLNNKNYTRITLDNSKRSNSDIQDGTLPTTRPFYAEITSTGPKTLLEIDARAYSSFHLFYVICNYYELVPLLLIEEIIHVTRNANLINYSFESQFWEQIISPGFPFSPTRQPTTLENGYIKIKANFSIGTATVSNTAVVKGIITLI